MHCQSRTKPTTISGTPSGHGRSFGVRRLPGKDFNLVKPREILSVFCVEALYTEPDHHSDYQSIECRLLRNLVFVCQPSKLREGTFT